MSKRYFQMDVSGDSAEIYIFGEITSWPWIESDVSSYGLAKQLAALDKDVKNITVHINSYGGECAEGVAIYNSLKNHPAHVKTVCDGMACSIASVIFMAGDERVMNEASLLMIHNAWVRAVGDSGELRKTADDLDIINNMSKIAYLDKTDLTEDELAEWMNAEKFIEPSEAFERGFATAIESDGEDPASQSARSTVVRRLAHSDAAELPELIASLREAVAAVQTDASPAQQAFEPAQGDGDEQAAALNGRNLQLMQAYLEMQNA